LSKQKASLDNKITNIPSKVQQIVGWAIQAELAKHQKQADNGRKLLAPMAKMLTKMRVFCLDIDKCIEYMSDCYNFTKKILNKGGFTLVTKQMFKWVSTLVYRIGK
jgi:predicted protein tyrosine phosphatase